MKINLDVVIDVTYKYAKFYYKILCIMGYTKVTKSNKIDRFEIYILRSRHLSFLCRPKYKVFEHEFLYICGINSWLHANIFYFLHVQQILTLRSSSNRHHRYILEVLSRSTFLESLYSLYI
jgi:hypothetical protein